MKVQTCQRTAKQFEVSSLEMSLRDKFGFSEPPSLCPEIRFQHIGAFWPHFALHKRTCDYSGDNIVSVYSEHCPYPVYHRDQWNEYSDPPLADFDPNQEVFPQLWSLFKRCAIPHNNGTHNENCEYTDDWWYSKNCFLCHSGIHCEDLCHCFRTYWCKDSQFLVFCFYTELSADTVHCFRCFNLIHSFYCRNCFDSAFLYDCRNCSNCLFCSNLRDKQYCIDNKQLTEEQFKREKEKWNFRSRACYEKAQARFSKIMHNNAVHRAVCLDQCQNSTGNFLENMKNCVNCYFVLDGEDSVNCIRGGPKLKNGVDSIGFAINTELLFNTALVIDNCYDIRCCFSVLQSRFMEHCGFCARCEQCFGCCGLIGKKYHIFNKAYEKENYFELKAKIISHMKQTKEYGLFFPPYFAPHPYEESWAGFYFPLSAKEQQELHFRPQEHTERRNKDYLSTSEIPDSSKDASTELTKLVFWDEQAKRPLRISEADIEFSQKLGIPLPNRYYAERLKDNFRALPFDGTLRTTPCGKCGAKILTTWPGEYDGRIFCESCYLETVK